MLHSEEGFTVDSLECPCLHFKGIPCFIFRGLQIGDLQINSCFCSHRWCQNCGCKHISEKCIFLRFREDFFPPPSLYCFLSFPSQSSLNDFFAFWYCLFLQCCLEATTKRFCLLSQVQLENHPLPIRVYNLHVTWMDKQSLFIHNSYSRSAGKLE